MSDRADVLRLQTLRTLRDIELDALILFQAAVTAGLDGRVVGEDVCSAVIRRDEAEALLRVEPLDGALRAHVLPSPALPGASAPALRTTLTNYGPLHRWQSQR